MESGRAGKNGLRRIIEARDPVASTATKLMTFAEFEKLPDQEIRQELRHGEVVNVAPPKHGHHSIQPRLQCLLAALALRAGTVGTEFGFQTGEFEYRIADVAFLSRYRWDQISVHGYLRVRPN